MYCLMLKMRQIQLSVLVVKAELSYTYYCSLLKVNTQSCSLFQKFFVVKNYFVFFDIFSFLQIRIACDLKLTKYLYICIR